ncbi:MAG TPA: hypothetical protein DCL86_18485 [Bacteroidales bacterium]|nr:hypothetical protein [Bacteroidales bacterium]
MAVWLRFALAAWIKRIFNKKATIAAANDTTMKLTTLRFAADPEITKICLRCIFGTLFANSLQSYFANE